MEIPFELFIAELQRQLNELNAEGKRMTEQYELLQNVINQAQQWLIDEKEFIFRQSLGA